MSIKKRIHELEPKDLDLSIDEYIEINRSSETNILKLLYDKICLLEREIERLKEFTGIDATE